MADKREGIGVLIEKYEEYKSEAIKINAQYESLEHSPLGSKYIRFIRIVVLDKKLSRLGHQVLNLINNIQVAIETAAHKGTDDFETLLGNASRLLESLTSLHRLNTHLYIVFSGGFAIAIAVLSVVLAMFL